MNSKFTFLAGRVTHAALLTASPFCQPFVLAGSLAAASAAAALVFPSAFSSEWESVALAADQPGQLGGGAARSRVAPSNSPVKVSERADNAVAKKKLPQSQREKREGKGNRVSRGEIESIGIEKQLGGALDRELAYTEKLLPKLPKKSDQRAEILRRLVENYHQKAMLTFFTESRTYDQRWKSWDQGGRRSTEPVLSQNESRRWTSQVIQRAQQMITEFPKHRRIDEAYFQIAYALDSVGQRKEAAKYYSQLVGLFPNSKRVADAHYALGEFYFDNQDYKKALTALSEVTRYTRAPIYPWAVYKIGWCHYNMQAYRNSLGSFQNVVRISASANDMSSGSKIRLKEEALRDMVLVFAELGDIDGAEKYFSEVGGEKYYSEMLIKLADILRERGQYDESVRVLKRFVARNPTSFKAAEIQIQIVDIAALKADKKLLWSEMKLLLSEFRGDSEWGKRHSGDKDFKEVADRVHAVSLTYAKKMHALGQKEKTGYFFTQAEIGYNLYLTYYPGRAEASEVRFHLGEIQYGQNRYREAVKTFWGIVKAPAKSPQFDKAADYLLSAAYLLVEPTMKTLRRQPAKLGGQVVPLAADMQEYIKVCDEHIKQFSKSKYVLDCQVDTAEISLKSQQYAEAEKRLTIIAKTYPTRKEGKTAAELLLWLSAGDKKKLLEVTDELSKIAPYTKGDLGKRLAIIKETHKFEVIGNMEKSGKNMQAAQEYERLAVASPNSKDADKAWFNAGVNYRKAGDAEKAVVAFTKVYGTFSKSPQAPEAILAIVEISEGRLQLDRAAQMSTEFISRYPADKRVPTIARETCYIYDALDDVARATSVCNQVMKQGGASALEASRTLADLYERKSRYREFIGIVDGNLLRMAVKPADKIEYLARAADAERKMGQAANAQRREALIASTFAGNKNIQGPGLAAVGRIEFEKHAPVLGRFKSTRLTALKKDASDLQQSIQAKLKSLEEVEKAYKKVLETGDSEWGVAALYQIGSAYEIFAQDLKSPPMPPGVTAADMVKLKDVLSENFSKPAAAKAKAFFLESSQVVSKFGVYTEYSEKTMSALARVSPGDHKRVDEYIPEALYVGTELMDVGKVGAVIDALGGGPQ